MEAEIVAYFIPTVYTTPVSSSILWMVENNTLSIASKIIVKCPLRASSSTALSIKRNIYGRIARNTVYS